MYVEKTDPLIKNICSIIGYSGKSIQIKKFTGPKTLDSYWDGGSRDVFYFLELATGKCLRVESNHPVFEANKPRELKDLPEGVVLVEHSIFCGKDIGITIFAKEENLTKVLPSGSKEEVSEKEKIVLSLARGLKSSYAGISDYRCYEAVRRFNLTKEEYYEVKKQLIGKGFLNKNGAINVKGRNVLEQKF